MSFLNGQFKNSYKELRNKLRNRYTRMNKKEYGIVDGVGYWLKQCDIKPTEINVQIICNIFGSVPYAYQEMDRLFIIDYLKDNKFKVYKNEFKNK